MDASKEKLSRKEWSRLKDSYLSVGLYLYMLDVVCSSPPNLLHQISPSKQAVLIQKPKGTLLDPCNGSRVFVTSISSLHDSTSEREHKFCERYARLDHHFVEIVERREKMASIKENAGETRVESTAFWR